MRNEEVMEVQKEEVKEAQSGAARLEGFELSPQQRRAWELRQAGGGLPYHAQCVVEIDGALDAAALTVAVRETVARHEILRTDFRQLPGMLIPVQVVTDDEADELSLFDLSALTADEQEHHISQWLADARLPQAEGGRVRPLRAALFARAGGTHALTLSLSTLYADRAGLENLVAAVARSYGAAAQSDVPAEEPLQYADLAAWQNELAAAEESEPGRAYWRESLPPEPGAPRLPGGGRHARAAEFDPRVLTATIGAESFAQLNARAARHDTTSQNVLLACWQLLLRRLGGLAEVAVGVRFSGRKYDELEESIGPLARYLPVRCDVDDELSFTELLARTTAATEAAARWQECFAWELTGAEMGDHGAPPFMPICFDFAREGATHAVAGVMFAPPRYYECLDQFHAKLVCRPRGDELIMELHYDASRLSVADVARLTEQYQTVLSSVARNPSARISELEIVGESERHHLLFELNDTQVELRRDTTLHRLFEEQAARTPEATAVVAADGALTYSELNARANRLAHYLRTLGVGPDVLVGVMLERSLEMLVGLLGVLKAGGAYVPLDSDYPQERLAFMAADAACPVLLTEQRLRTRFDGHAGPLAQLAGNATRVFCLDTEWAAVAGLSAENLTGGAQPASLAYVIYTSGSTGRPKGVMVAHAAICNRLLWMQAKYPLTPSDRVLQKTAFSFDASIWELFVPLLCGAQVVMARPGGQHDAAYLCAAIQAHEVTTLQLVPTMLAVVLEEAGFGACRSLRRVWCGGEVVTPELARRFFTACPHPDLELHNLYGPTETAIDASHWLCERAGAGGRVPIGRPLANLQAYVLDARMQPVPLGVAGELYVGGVQLARGYWRRPDLTAERFGPNLYGGEMGGRLYRTGDVARWTGAGVLEYLGRADAQVKLRGYRVELGEVEALLDTHPEVRETVVCLREDRPGDQRLVAYVVAERGAAPTAEELRRFAGEKLPDFMLPSAFVFLEALPLAPNGKLDRRALPPPAADGASDAQAYVAPCDEVERALVRLWEEILDVHPVGVTDDFFLLGGHSVLALRVVGQIHKLFGKEVPLATMIQAGTIENLARMLRAEPRLLPWDPLVTIQPEGTKTPFFAIHSIGGQVFCYVSLARHLGPEQPFYGLQAPALEDVGHGHVAIEDMAAHYVKAMLDVQPAGPYMLGGYSFGVQVAFEMACQLKAQGQEVALLALLDSPSPIELHKLPPYEDDDAFMFALRGKVAAFERGRTIEMTRHEFDGLDYEAQLAHLHKRMVDEDLFPPEHDIEFLRHFMAGYKTRQKAVRFYHPKPYPGRITLFRAAETDPWLAEHFIKAGVDINDKTCGWGALSTEPVAVYEIPGNHDRMCYEPHVRVLAKRLRQCIDKALNGNAGSSAQGWAGEILRKG
ncbi:MAG: non-ribosomal peptide synthetase [Pyrinomonadaceae bacterium]